MSHDFIPRVDPELEQRAINTIRGLVIDSIESSGGGHPGMPLGMAPAGYTLFTRHLTFNPLNPRWPNRDRYVQSAGHGSTLLYSMLHLSGFDIGMEELKRHRRWGSRTPGHPEYCLATGIETTTGPLGQGIATAVGMALGEAHLAARFNRDGFSIVDHYTFVIASDGDMMEGISGEASSLAGHLGLGKLIVLYDDNGISIDGTTDVTFSEDVGARYRAYGWHTATVDGNDPTAISGAIDAAKLVKNRPSLISVRTVIGYGSPNRAGTPAVHGAALGAEEAALTKTSLGIDWPPFTVPEDVGKVYAEPAARGRTAEEEWSLLMERYRAAHPELAAQFERTLAAIAPAGLGHGLPQFPVGEAVATRKASHIILNALAANMPELLGGSADLAASNYTDIEAESPMTAEDYSGRIIRFGIREHAMAAIANGLALYGGLRPFIATFLVFSDYLRPALRLSALMQLPVIGVFTHDSIAVGEDGPTHQPVDQLLSLRAIPNLTVLRPADANETRDAWLLAASSASTPTVLALSRQELPNLHVPAGGVQRGAYVIAEAHAPGGLAEGGAGGWSEPPHSAVTPAVILIGTGSEVQLCLAARDVLEGRGIATRVVSMPSQELFEQQESTYRKAVLPDKVRTRVAVEAGATLGWERYAGSEGKIIGVDRFGDSAPGPVVQEKLGISVDAVLEAVFELLSAEPLID